MTWYLDPDTLDVFDHTGEIVGQADRATIPDEVHRIMLDVLDGSQPNAYNQALLFDAATNNIEFGTPDQS